MSQTLYSFETLAYVARLYQNVTIQAGDAGLILATPSDPRTIGLTLRIRH